MKKMLFRIAPLMMTLITILLLVTACGHEHSFGEWTVEKDATCTDVGSKVRVCECGETETTTISAKGHTGGEWIVDANATCTENGSKHQVCSVCTDTIKTETIKSVGKHSYTSKVTTSATCTTDGVKTYTCSACQDTYTEKISAKGHSWKSATCIAPKTCSVCNATNGNALGHNKGANGYCTRCNEKLTIDMNTVVGNPNDCATTKYFGFCYYKNSVDGIKVCWGGENLSGKTINYYTVTVYFYNSVGDPAYSEITGESSKTIKYVGPVAPGEDLIIYGIVDYVPVCSKVVIGEITVEYADGTSDTGWYGWYTTYKNSAIK